MAINGAQQEITAAVAQWEGIVVQPHRFGGVEYVIGKREVGHLHGDRMVDIPFPTKVRNELVAAGRADPHHLMADSGWVSFYLEQNGDVEAAIALLRQSYEIAVGQKRARQAGVE
jgi:predicted DNA-binding protein (MmcQ/YjbR family)